MNRFGIVIALVVIVAVILGCADDLVLKGEESMVGKYEGTYTLTTNLEAPNEVTVYNHIFWTFFEDNYVMEIDVDNNTNHCFCRVDGLWLMEEGVRLKEQHTQPFGPAGCQACDDEENPEGDFVRERKADTLILSRQDGTTFKQLRLTRITVSEPEE